MIKGQKYTISSDLWSAGILLYAMCMGELPFEDDNMQRLLQKIAYTEPMYPSTISPPLKDLLCRLLTKDPAERITLQKIKVHPWFSQYQLSQMMDMNFGINYDWRVVNQGHGGEIDREIILRMNQYGYDCTHLVQDLIENNTNPLTAVYKMLRKVKITDEMADISMAALGTGRKLRRGSTATASSSKVQTSSFIKRVIPGPHPAIIERMKKPIPTPPTPSKLIASRLNPEVASSMTSRNHPTTMRVPSRLEPPPKFAKPFANLPHIIRKRSNSMREQEKLHY